jgi:hypothetical protein
MQLGGQVMDIPIALLERAGDVVSQRELIDRVWPNVTVADSNPRSHVVALRRALSECQDGGYYVINDAERDNSVIITIRSSARETTATPVGPVSPVPLNSPRLKRVVGGDALVELIAGRRAGQCFVTIVGPRGIGKTTVAVSVDHAFAAEYGVVCFVNWEPLVDSRLEPSLLTTSAGVCCPVLPPDPQSDQIPAAKLDASDPGRLRASDGGWA